MGIWETPNFGHFGEFQLYLGPRQWFVSRNSNTFYYILTSPAVFATGQFVVPSRHFLKLPDK